MSKLSSIIPPDRLAKGLWWGEPWSLVDGCTKVSAGCANCWAESNGKRFGRWPETATIQPGRLNKPLKAKRPTVFTIWNDLFHENVTFEFVEEAWDVMFDCPQHFFLILTKRPERMSEFCNYYMPRRLRNANFKNIYFGTTAENQEQLEIRLPHLLQVPGRKFLSIEPMLGPMDLVNSGAIKWELDPDPNARTYWGIKNVDWVIAGCESRGHGLGRLAKKQWFIDLAAQCQAAGVSFFLKQMDVGGRLCKAPVLGGRQWLETPEVSDD
jgi:protein gp37